MRQQQRIEMLLAPVIVILFVVLSLPFLHAPASQDDFWNFGSAAQMPQTRIPFFYRGGVPHLEHPPLYLYLLSFFLTHLGATLVSARLLGISIASLTLLASFFFYRRFSQKEPNGLFLTFFPVVLLATSPMLIQGAQLIDMDGTLLLLSFSLLSFAWVFWGEVVSRKRDLILGALFALALWSKLVTPLFLPLGILMTAIFLKRTKDLWFFLRPFCIGLLLFVTTWFIYCLKERALSSFWDLLGYHLGAAEVLFVQKIHTTFSLSKMAGAFTRFGAWLFWPFLILLGMGWFSLQKGRQGNAFAVKSLLNSLLLGSLIYLLTKGLSFSFPKYHVPFLPVFCVVAASPMRSVTVRPKTLLIFLICLIGLAFFQAFVVGDFLYLFLFQTKEALVMGAGKEVALRIFGKGLLSLFSFFLAFGIVYLSQRKEGVKAAFLLALAAMALASNLSEDFLQGRAPYLTGNLYGDSSRREVLALLKKTLKSGDILIAHDLIHFELGSFSSPMIPSHLWEDPEAILGLLEKTGARALVYSLSTNTVHQYRNTFLKKEFQEKLEEHFDRNDLGPYTVWIRRR